ncbi:uncharacterized protein N7498_002354 [Penicillium cinerascens]|uniref:RING-type domain-containing protein n=1 Tax=Penicillium cinerascens TaxID=70096 RepID=A0A9W9N9X2_9EURO|nr:uncharacterized protein N7498_002354 [Penicillium cinerascens]KAJ5215947.1 hypothetical protein N7498_002354 [Penicillium cinerascens]
MAANMACGSGSEAEASGLFNTLQTHVNDIRNLIQCGICIRPLYEPYTLACGHTFCYSCLSSWFSGGRSKRTCPDCRAPVKNQPAPAYLVRAVVHMFTSRAELLDKGETTAEHSKYQQEEAGRLDKDKANTDPQKGGLFGGLFNPKAPSLKPVVDVDDGVVRCPTCAWELEDGEECLSCGWRYRPDDERTDYSGEDDISETDYDSIYDGEDLDEVEFGGVDAEDMFNQFGSFGAPPYRYADPNIAVVSAINQAMNGLWHPNHPQAWRPRPHPHPQFHPHPRPHSHPHPAQMFHSEVSEGDEEDEEDEEDEYDDMDSFIDDDEVRPDREDDAESDGVTVVGSAPIRNRALPSWGPPRYSDVSYAPISEDEEEGSEVYEEEDSFAEARQPWEVSSPSSHSPSFERPSNRGGAGSGPVFHDTRSSPMVSEAETNDAVDPEMAHAHRYYEEGFYPTDHDSGQESDSSAPRPMRPVRTTGISAVNAITIDDSEDEQPVGPVRRATQRRRARATPY